MSESSKIDRQEEDRRKEERRKEQQRKKEERRKEKDSGKQLNEWERAHPHGHAGHPFD